MHKKSIESAAPAYKVKGLKKRIEVRGNLLYYKRMLMKEESCCAGMCKCPRRDHGFRMKLHTFHCAVWRVLRFTLSPWLRRKFNYTPEVYSGDGPCLVLCNHNTDWDPLLLGCAFEHQMYFVASEHIFRWGLVTRLIRLLVDPIPRLKGSLGTDTALSVMRRLHTGCSVAIFAEGNRSFTGVTGEILPSTGKLARVCGATLVTYRLEGGYFTSPRWCGSSLRRGRMRGHLAGVYTSQQLRSMSVSEINEAIRRDLYCDAYAQQREEMVKYSGTALAEHLETLLCICPRCGSVGGLVSDGDWLRCSCGFETRFNEYGFLEGDAPFDNLKDWDEMQTRKIESMLGRDGAIFSDSDMRLYELGTGHISQLIGCGEMSLYRDRLECCGIVFPLSQLCGFSLFGPQNVSFSLGSAYYEIHSDKLRCTRKYMTAIELLTKAARSR